MQNIKKYVKDLMCIVSPELLSRYPFMDLLGQKLDLSNPRGLNEKITWLKLNTYRNNRLVTSCSDKYSVREYMAFGNMQRILTGKAFQNRSSLNAIMDVGTTGCARIRILLICRKHIIKLGGG